MDFSLYNSRSILDIKALFTDVFTDSEGQAEGELIGQLAFDLPTITPSSDLFGFVAQQHQQMIGCLFFSRITFATDTNAFILSPVAIATRYQHQGIGQQLIKFGINHLKNNKVDLIFTYGDPHFYAKVGFQAISETLVKAPLTLTYPEGWLAQSLRRNKIEPIQGDSTCVSALNNPVYW